MRSRRFWLYVLLLTALTAALFPILELLRLLSGASDIRLLPMLGVWFLCTWLGMCGVLSLRKPYMRHPRIGNLAIWGIALLVTILGAILVPYPTWATRVCYGILAGGCFFGGAKLLSLPPEQLAHAYVFVGLCLWDCFLGICIDFCGGAVPYISMLGILAANAALFALVHNRNAMERMLSDRGGDTWVLPQEIHRSNRKWLGLFFCVGVLLLLCSRPLAAALRRLWRWFYTGLWYGLRWLLSLGSGEDVTEQTEHVPDTAIPLEQSGSAVWIRWVIELGILALLLGLVIWKRHAIAEAIERFWDAVRRWVRMRLEKTPRQHVIENTAYCDYVEDLLTHDKIRNVALHGGYRSRKQAYRRYRRLPLGTERFRLGYALALEQLPEAIRKPSDSPQEILERVCATYPNRETFLAQWARVTAVYSDVRYGEAVPNEDAFSALDAVLQLRKEL